MTFGSLFTGIGGLDLGLERVGMTCIWQSEIDPFCCKVLEKHWPAKNLGDIRKILNPPQVDLLCGGFPCQPFSVAGRQKGIDDPRWLWPEFLRIIKEIQPKYILGENVRGLLRNEGFTQILNDLHAAGYDAEWETIPASFIGAPHKRERVFIFAYPSGSGLQGSIFETSLRSQSPKAPTIFGNRNIACGNWWRENLPSIFMGDGISTRLARPRVKALGNAVVPAVAELIGQEVAFVGTKVIGPLQAGIAR